MKIIGILILSIIPLTKQDESPLPTERYPHYSVLDTADNYYLYWKFDDTTITFEVLAKTTGWVGVGISPNGGMAYADMYVGWVKDGVTHFTERHGTSRNEFPPKVKGHYASVIEGSEKDSWTKLTFRRPIKSCKNATYASITPDTLKMIWAVGASDPPGDDITPNDYHKAGTANRGTKSLILLEPTGVKVEVSGETYKTHEFRNHNFEIPPISTYYSCQLHKFPTLNEKHHMVAIEPIITSGNERYVHHILIYQCSYEAALNDSHLNINTMCYGPNMPPDFGHCSKVVHGWAIGGGTFYYPLHAGYPLGMADSPKYVLIEIHYDNPAKIDGVIDSSGLRVLYTLQLRQHDAGVMQVGHSVSPYSNLIPPNAESFLAYGECPKDCLAAGIKAINKPFITVFGALLHSHLLGRRLTLRHIKSDGKELPYISQDNSYDFNYQETRFLSKEVEVYPSDTMQFVCDYKTKRIRENFTAGGLATNEEMCLVYVYYYPKIPVVVCETAPRMDLMLQYFGITNFMMTSGHAYGSLKDILALEPQEFQGKTLDQVLATITWDEDKIQEMSRTLRDMNRTYTCKTVEGVSEYGEAVKVTEPYKIPPLPPCKEARSGSADATSSCFLTFFVLAATLAYN